MVSAVKNVDSRVVLTAMAGGLILRPDLSMKYHLVMSIRLRSRFWGPPIGFEYDAYRRSLEPVSGVQRKIGSTTLEFPSYIVLSVRLATDLRFLPWISLRDGRVALWYAKMGTTQESYTSSSHVDRGKGDAGGKVMGYHGLWLWPTPW